MLPDYHFHSNFSGDSDTPIRSQIEQALLLGMKSICVTDHHDYDVDSPIDFTLRLPSLWWQARRISPDYAGAC